VLFGHFFEIFGNENEKFMFRLVSSVRTLHFELFLDGFFAFCLRLNMNIEVCEVILVKFH